MCLRVNVCMCVRGFCTHSGHTVCALAQPSTYTAAMLMQLDYTHTFCTHTVHNTLCAMKQNCAHTQQLCSCSWTIHIRFVDTLCIIYYVQWNKTCAYTQQPCSCNWTTHIRFVHTLCIIHYMHWYKTPTHTQQLYACPWTQHIRVSLHHLCIYTQIFIDSTWLQDTW